MKFNIAKFEKAGFIVRVEKDSIEIQGPPTHTENWLRIRSDIETSGIRDPGLVDYVAGAYLDALHRARILELAE